MRRTLLLTAAFGAALLSGAAAQAQGTASPGAAPQGGTSLGTPMTQPQPGGGVATGPGAPTSAVPAAPGSAPAGTATQGRGPPPPGSATPPPQGSSSQLGPTGAIQPGAQGGESGTGGSQSSSTP
jgi:hypothetical protein